MESGSKRSPEPDGRHRSIVTAMDFLRNSLYEFLKKSIGTGFHNVTLKKMRFISTGAVPQKIMP
jgi:hypothetical protein